MIILKEKLLLLSLILILISMGIVLITPYLTGADAISYISIAKKYALGQWKEAINGHWSPLISWLLVPSVWLKFNLIIAAKILCVLIGGFALFAFWLLLKKLSFLDKTLRLFIMFSAMPLILHHSIVVITPDLLIASIILIYFNSLWDSSYFSSWKKPVFCGAIGTLFYLAKSYGFVFFLFSFLFHHLYFFIISNQKTKRKKVIVFFLLGLIIFLLTSFPWIYALKQKYGYWTISTAPCFNLAQIAPHIAFKQMELWGLIPPPNESALSYWEDPNVVPFETWNPFSSKEDFLYWLGRTIKNFKDWLSTIWDDSPLAPLILFGGIILCFWPRRHQSAFLITMNLLIYSSGFLLLFILDRYLYFVEFSLLLLGAYLLSLWPRFKKKIFVFIFYIFLISFSISFVYKPILLIYKICTHNPVTPFKETDKEIYLWAKAVDKELAKYDHFYRHQKKHPESPLPIANIATLGNWNRGIFVSYYLRLRYFGDLMPYQPEEIIPELKQHKIDYLFVFGEIWPQEKKLSSLPIVLKRKYFRLYDVRPLQRQS